MTFQAMPYVLLLGFFYGSTLIASRFSVGQFEPVTYIGLRLTIASLGHATVYALASHRRWPSSRRLWRHAILLGIFGTAVPMTAIVTALQFQSGGITSLLITANPALTVLLAHFFLSDENLNWRKGAGVALALGGAAALALQGETGLPDVDQASSVGYGLVLLAMISGSSMTVYARKYMREMDALDVASVRMLVATVAVMPLSMLLVGLELEGVDGQGYFALVYAALVGTFGGMMLAFYNVKRFGATAAAMTAYVIPIVAGVGGVIFLGETVTPIMLVGMAIIALGIALINRGGNVEEPRI